ncbi:BMP-binding endothelial regulator protein-like [Saccoglossus kowalevskii]
MKMRLLVIISLVSLTLAAPKDVKSIGKRSGCNQNYNIPANGEVVITSPHFPGNYNNNANCVWIITTESNAVFRVEFTHFDVEDEYDRLTVFDGSNMLQSYDNSNKPESFTSTHSEIKFHFTSDSSFTLSGFRAIITSQRSVFGDPHMTTFDGRRYNFQGLCWYVLAKDCSSATPDFEITAKFEVKEDSTTDEVKTRTAAFNVTVGNEYANIDRLDVFTGRNDGKIAIDKIIQTVKDNKTITLSFVVKETKITLKWTLTKHVLNLSIFGSEYSGKLCGLMGNNDGDMDNDFQKPDGSLTDDVDDFGESWKVNDIRCD